MAGFNLERNAENVIDNMPDIFVLEILERWHSRPLDAGMDSTEQVDRTSATAVDSKCQVPRLVNVVPDIMQTGF